MLNFPVPDIVANQTKVKIQKSRQSDAATDDAAIMTYTSLQTLIEELTIMVDKISSLRNQSRMVRGQTKSKGKM